jgi:hypothetical protein
MSQNGNSSAPIGFGGALLILFITLKLTGVIAWSWWWVLALLWIPMAIAGVILIAVFGPILVDMIVTKARGR